MKTVEQRFLKKCLKKVQAKGLVIEDHEEGRRFHVENSSDHRKAYKIAKKVAEKLAAKTGKTLAFEGRQHTIRLNGSSVYITGTFYSF